MCYQQPTFEEAFDLNTNKEVSMQDNQINRAALDVVIDPDKTGFTTINERVEDRFTDFMTNLCLHTNADVEFIHLNGVLFSLSIMRKALNQFIKLEGWEFKISLEEVTRRMNCGRDRTFLAIKVTHGADYFYIWPESIHSWATMMRTKWNYKVVEQWMVANRTTSREGWWYSEEFLARQGVSSEHEFFEMYIQKKIEKLKRKIEKRGKDEWGVDMVYYGNLIVTI